LLVRLRTTLLLLLTVALVVSFAFLVPELEAEAERAGAAGDAGAILEASAPSLPSLRTGLVEFERTEDVEYIVAEGETLSEIAQRHRIEYETLARYNDLRDPNTIVAGQVIVVPGTTSLLGAEQ
jgi:nucleoid-associated protein YgaU